MPIVRSWVCPKCNHYIEMTLTAEQWDIEAPDCPRGCQTMDQEFTPPAIGGSAIGKAHAIAEKIAREDYNVTNLRTSPSRSGPRATYKDEMMGHARVNDRNWGPDPPSTWGSTGLAMSQAMAFGKDLRHNFGNGLDVLQATLKSGAQPDLLETSKRMAVQQWRPRR